jgi:hypothetical protein
MFHSIRPRRTLSLLLAIAATAAIAHAGTLSASATISGTQISPGVYDYSIDLSNTGTTTIGTFWFSWVPGAGFLSATPSDVWSPTGWTDAITNGGAAIQWISNSSSSLLQPGWSLTGFGFESTETPAELLLDFTGSGTGSGDPVLTSTVYTGAPFSSNPDIFAVAETPEPNTLLLTLSGLGLAAASLKSRFLRRS